MKKIIAIITEGNVYGVGREYGVDPLIDAITEIQKNGDMAYITWYQLWHNGEVVGEINSRFVVEVKYTKGG